MAKAQTCIRSSRTQGDCVSSTVLKERGDSVAVDFVSMFQNPNNYYKIYKQNKRAYYCAVQLLPKPTFRFDKYLPKRRGKVLNAWINVRTASRKV